MTINELFPDIYMEDSNVEFKGILSKGKDKNGNSLEMDWLKTIAAFANGEGGRLFVGVENKSHKIVALDTSEADKQILMLHQEIRNRFDPVIYPEVKKHVMPWDGHNILLEIIVKHSSFLPVFVNVISEKMEWSFRNSGMLFRNKRNEESFWSKARPFKSYSEASFC